MRQWMRLQVLSGMGISGLIHVILLLSLALVLLPGLQEQTELETIVTAEEVLDEADFEELEPLKLDVLSEVNDLHGLTSPPPGPLPPNLLPGNVSLEGLDPGTFGGTGLGNGPGLAILEQAASYGGKSGPIQITLVWQGATDLDLHVVAPSGEKIYFAHPSSRCGGELDVDMNNGSGRQNSLAPVENIVWTDTVVPRTGKYMIYVHHYALRGTRERQVPFRVAIKVEDRVAVHDGVARAGEGPAHLVNFHYKSTQTVPVTIDPERQAASRLRLARQMLERNQVVGRERLEELIREFPDTSAANTARGLLQAN